MAELDVSLHSLNSSMSKQKYSFPKTKRFNQSNKPICESFYEIPSTKSKRATMLGYGDKSFGIDNNKFLPGVGTYKLQGDINPQKNKHRSITFGVSRNKMQLGGPLGNVKKFLEKLPAPCAYQAKDVSDRRAPSLRSRLPDNNFEKFVKNPGPGAYNHDQMGQKSYYLNSRYKNTTNLKISQVSRSNTMNKNNPVGPSDYPPIDVLNSSGRYKLARHHGIQSCVFNKSQRQGPVQKLKILYPGPGQYNSFSNFG